MYLRMHRKLLAVCLMLVGIIVVPTSASAAELLSGSSPVTVGTEVVGTAPTNVTFSSSFGTFTCSSSTIAGRVNTNSGGTVKIDVSRYELSGTGTEGRCLKSDGTQVRVVPSGTDCLSSTTAGSWSMVGGTCGKPTVAQKMTLFPAGGGECEFYR